MMQSLSSGQQCKRGDRRDDAIPRGSRGKINLLLLLPGPFWNSSNRCLQQNDQSCNDSQTMRSHAERTETTDRQGLHSGKPDRCANNQNRGDEEAWPKLTLSGRIALGSDAEAQSQNCDINQQSQQADRHAEPISPLAVQDLVAA